MHDKTIRFFILCLFPFSLTAQKYQLTFDQKANYSVYNLQGPFTYRGPYGPYSRMRLGYEGEARLYYTPKEKLSYYAGIGFIKYNYEWDEYTKGEAAQLSPKKGYLITVNQYYSFNYLGLPLGARYSFGKRWMVSGGIRVLRLLSQYSYPKYYGQKTPTYNKKTFDNQRYSPWVLNLTVEVGYTLPVFKYDITWKAAFEYAVTDYISNKYPALNLYPYTFSIGASFPLVKF